MCHVYVVTVGQSMSQSASHSVSSPASQSVSKSVDDVCVCMCVRACVWTWCGVHILASIFVVIVRCYCYCYCSSEHGLFVAYSKVISCFYWFQVLQFIFLLCNYFVMLLYSVFHFYFLFTTCLTKFIIYMCVMYVWYIWCCVTYLALYCICNSLFHVNLLVVISAFLLFQNLSQNTM